MSNLPAALLSLALASNSEMPTSFTKSNQEVTDSRVLRNSLTSLLPFPFKACSERIIDFHFLSAHKDKIFWPPFYFASVLDRVLRGGDWELIKQRNTTRHVEFSDAFKIK